MPISKAGTASSTTTNLLHLLPTYTTSTLPTPLVELATSLYATSKARAAILKKDEEIAREYACAVLAVERLKKPLRLPVDKLEPRPPVPPRVFDRLLRFLDNAVPAGPSTPSKRKAQDTHGTPKKQATSSKRGRPPKDSQIDPQLRQLHSPEGGGKVKRGSKSGSSTVAEKERPVASGASNTALLPGCPRWLSRFVVRLKPKLQAQLSGHSEKPIFTNATLLDRIMSKGVSTVRTSAPEAAQDNQIDAVPSKKDNTASIVIAVLIVALQHHLGHDAVEVRNIVRLAVQDLAAGGVVKMTAFGGVLREAQDLVQDKGMEWRNSSWCQATVEASDDIRPDPNNSEDVDMPDAPPQDNEQLRTRSPGAAGDNESLVEKVPLSRCGPIAQAHPDWLSPARKREYAQWEAKILKQIAAIEKQQAHDGDVADD